MGSGVESGGWVYVAGMRCDFDCGEKKKKKKKFYNIII